MNLPRPLLQVAAVCVAPLVVLLVAAVAWPLLAIALLVDGFGALRPRRRAAAPARPRDCTAASIVIVSWNGKHFLERLLPSLWREIEAHGGDHEVIVVDNGSVDGSVAWLADAHPRAKVVALPENRYFVRGNKAGVEVATRDVVVFLNNDMVVEPGFLAPLLDGLRDPRVFGVAAEVRFADPAKRREETGRTTGCVRAGWLKLAHELPTADESELRYAPTFWAGGGSSAFDRRIYLELGGFDTLFDPFYLEDTGLSYLAWKRGHDLLFTAHSRVIHEHRGTSRKAFGDDFIDNMIRRNQHLFLWRHLTDAGLFAQVMGLLPFGMLARSRRPGRSLLYGQWFELRAFLKALPRFVEAMAKRWRDRPLQVRGDREVFTLASSVHGYRRSARAELGRVATPQPDGLRVLVLSSRLPKRGVDGSWVLFDRLVELARRHRITLAAFADDDADSATAGPLRAAGIRVEVMVREHNRAPGNLHHAVPHRLWRDYSAPAMRKFVARVLDGTDFDVVQVEYIEMANLVRGAIAGLPAVYTCHESNARAAARHGGGWAWAQADRHERAVLRDYRRIVALAEPDAGYLRAALPRVPVDVSASGLDLARWRASPLPAQPVIGFVGYFQHAPNVDAALWLCREVLPLVRAELPQARVCLIGRAAPPSVQALAGEAVEVAGHVDDLPAAMARMAVVAMPLRQGGGLRGKVLEAWAACRPVVATPVAVEGLEVRDGEHCLVAADARAFAAALLRCLREPALADRLVRHGRALLGERYTTAAAAARHEAALRQVATP